MRAGTAIGVTPHRAARYEGPHAGDLASGSRRAAVAFQLALYTAFLLSGAAALLYETLWTRYLALFLGHSAYAQVIVLMIFLGGTAAGALLVAELSERLRRPLVLYGAAELVVALLGAAFPALYRVTTTFALGTVFPRLGPGAASILFQWSLAALLILPQSVLLGTTFPAMSAAIMRRMPRNAGSTLATLYFVNGFGGAIGVLVGGFSLVRAYGLSGALDVGACLSAIAGVLALVMAIVRQPLQVVPATELGSSDTDKAKGDASPYRVRELLLAVSFGTAVASLMYEIAWTRMLSLVLGSATHSFELMLSAFILGMSLGALWLRRRADRFARPLRALGQVQLAMGALALATLPLYVASFKITLALMRAADVTPEGYTLFNLGRYGICLAVMLPATFCAGITLPLIMRVLLPATGEATVGLVYGANTIGSIVGAAGAAILLMPLIGLKPLMISAAAIDMALGVWIFAAGSGRRPRRRGAMIAAAFAMACVALATRVDFNRELLTSGIFRARRLFPLGTNKILFYRDGRTATVSGTYASPATIMLATNGKVDASLDDAWLRPPSLGARPRTFTADASTQALLAVLALAHEPRARTAAVVGQGSGMTSHLLLGSSQLRSLTTLEIEPQMIEGSNVFYPANRRVFEDPRSHFVIEDARSYLAASPNRYDLIISEPSNPWVSGVASLFTTEFYRIASSRLAPGGALAQWIQLYEINDDLLLSILAAIHANFRSYTLYQASVMDLVVVATNDSTLPPPDWSVVRWPTLAADLHNFIPLTPQSLDALWMADRDVFAPLIEHGIEPNSDEHPVLDLEAERERYLNHSAREFVMLGTHRFDPFAALRHHKFAPATEQETTTPEIARAQMQALAARLRVGLDAAHDTLPPVRDYPPMLMRKRMLEAFIAHGAPPPDWQLWMRTVAIVEKDVQGAASGVADESFYAPIYSFMRANNAPVRAFAALDFMHGLASWNFQQASTAADILMPDADLGEGWVPNDMFRDGTVVAKLETGDVAGARKAFETLTPLVGSRSDLRSRLLAAQIR